MLKLPSNRETVETLVFNHHTLQPFMRAAYRLSMQMLEISSTVRQQVALDPARAGEIYRRVQDQYAKMCVDTLYDLWSAHVASTTAQELLSPGEKPAPETPGNAGVD
ncbi:hypothetical protein [Catalinimonas alkaloidigena]|uniref:hypothetical protein n=1 Tax=Catalinimonas alkaloidigena TaxID=1075417 RepID=UPI00115FB616|nr:hypothetical protein [Catalinimonas alkaloidigena]